MAAEDPERAAVERDRTELAPATPRSASTPATDPTLLADPPATAPTLLADPPAAGPRLADQLARADLKSRLFGAPAESARIGRFAVLRKIGAGGMGVVYAAYDEELDRKLAVKLVRPGRDDPDARARSRREAQALARLSHPNVVQVYEVGEYQGQVYLAMEFVQGQTLRAWQTLAPRRWQDTVAMYLQAGRGLAAAHARGLVHRDFKPESELASQVLENTSVSRLRRWCVPIVYQARGPRQDRAARGRVARLRDHARVSLESEHYERSQPDMNVSINLESYDLAAAEQRLCIEALAVAGNIVDAAKLLGVTRHALKRRMVKHRIPWPRRYEQPKA